jgi:hypothetical protein
LNRGALRRAPGMGSAGGVCSGSAKLAGRWSEGGITLASNKRTACAASPDLPAQIATATALTLRQPSPGTGEGGGSQAAGWGAQRTPALARASGGTPKPTVPKQFFRSGLTRTYTKRDRGTQKLDAPVPRKP